MSFLKVVAILVGLTGIACQNIRWFRVAQREHYLPGSVNRFSRLWSRTSRINFVLEWVAFVGVVLALYLAAGPLITGFIAIFYPLGLSLRGRTSKLVWTARMRRVALASVALELLIVPVGFLLGHPFAALTLTIYFVPTAIDLALKFLVPLEKRKATKFVDSARKRLKSVSPQVIAITGSYGKTSTKQCVAHLISSTKSTFASPASFNNRAGLSKAVNEHLTSGTEVFIAEMGTYGVGEIAELCEIFEPQIAVLTAIGPVHLERMKTEDTIVKAKSEIFAKASVAILNVDDDRLARVADAQAHLGKTVWRCGTTDGLDVQVTASSVVIKGRTIFEGELPDLPATNVACAVAVASQVGVTDEAIAQRLPDLPVAQHRQEVAKTPEGLTIVDDTFNANPASVQRALEVLARQSPSGKHVVVTPGIVELGDRQDDENRLFGKNATSVADEVIVVGRTNRASLVAGIKDGGMTPIVVDQLADAVAWVRQHVGSGDSVAYINDLPDHFP